MPEIDEDAKAFMSAVLSATNAGGANQLAGRLVADRRLSYGEGRKVAKWARGENFPDGKSTLMLLDVAGFLTDEARQLLGLPAARPGSAGGMDDEIVRLQDEGDEVSRALRALDEPPQAEGGTSP